MAAVEIGRVQVRALPNTAGFRKELEAKLKAISKQVQAMVPVDFDLDSKGFARKANETVQRAKASMPKLTATADLDDAYLKESLRRAQAAVKKANLSIPATVEGEELRRSLQRSISVVQHQVTAVGVPVDVEGAAQFRARVNRMVESIEAKTANITVEADAAEAEARLAALNKDSETTVTARARIASATASLASLTRARTADVFVNLKGVTAAKTYLSALTGGNVMGRASSEVSEMFKNFDMMAVRASATATSLAAISSLSVSAAGGIASVVSSLASIAPAALALPGIASGFMVGILGSADGLQNIGMQIEKVSREAGQHFSIMDQFLDARLEGGMQFWASAKESLMALRDNFLVPFFTEYRGMMGNLGVWWNQFFQGFLSGLSKVGGLGALFQPLNQAILLAADGAAPLVEAMVRIGAVGGTYLPALAQGFTDVATRMGEWANASIDSGQMFDWIDTGIQNLKLLFSVAGNVIGILAGVGKAANDAGGGGLSALVGVLQTINGIVNGGDFQGALTTVFSGAFEGVKNLLPGISALGAAFVALAPTISGAMGSAGEIISTLMGGIAQVLANPAFSSGISELFKGILVAAQALVPAIAELGPKVGAVAATFGTLVATLAPIIAQIVVGLAPAFAQLLVALQPVIVSLGTGLVAVLTFLIPIISQVITWVAGFMQQFPGLSAVILVVAAALGGFIALVVQVITFLGPVFGVISSVVEIVMALGGSFAFVGTAITTVIGFLGTIISVIGSVVAAFFSWPVLIGIAIAALVVLIVTNWDKIVKWTADTWAKVSNFAITSFLNIYKKSQEILGAIGRFISGIWNGIVRVATTALALFVAAVVGGFSRTRDFASNALGNLLNIVVSIFRSVVSYIVSSVTNFTSAVASGIRNVVSFFGGLGSSIYGTVGNIARNMVTIGKNIIIGLINGIVSMAGNVSSAIGKVVGGAVDFAKRKLRIHSPSRVFMEIGSFTGQGLVKGIEGETASVQSAMGAMVAPPSVSVPTVPTVPSFDAGSASEGWSSSDGSQSLTSQTIAEAFAGMRFVMDTGYGETVLTAYNQTNRRSRFA